MKRALLVPGHAAVYPDDGRGGGTPARFTVDGTQLAVHSGPGCGRCQCGKLSPVLSSAGARGQWHRRHREEVAEVPWSDAATARA